MSIQGRDIDFTLFQQCVPAGIWLLMLGFGCLDVGFWLWGRWILVVRTLDFGCDVVGFWLWGRWILVVGTLDFGCGDVGFWL